MIVYLILNNGRPEQVFAVEADAVEYVGSKGGHNIQPFHLSVLGKGGIVLPFTPLLEPTAKEENQPGQPGPELVPGAEVSQPEAPPAAPETGQVSQQ